MSFSACKREADRIRFTFGTSIVLLFLDFISAVESELKLTVEYSKK